MRHADAFVVDSFIDRATNFGVNCGLGHGDPHEVAALPHRIEVPENDLLDLFLERIPVGQSAHEVLDYLRGATLENGEEKAAFAVEVTVNEAVGAVGPLSYLACRSAVIAALREHGGCGVNQGLATLLFVALTALDYGAWGDRHGPSPAHVLTCAWARTYLRPQYLAEATGCQGERNAWI